MDVAKKIHGAQCAMLSSALVVVAYVFPLLTGWYVPGLGLEHLGYVVQLEWLVTASGLFLLMPLIMITTSRGGQIGRLVFFAGVVIAVAMAISNEWGLAGVVHYFLLTFLTYGGSSLFIRDDSRRNLATLLAAARWMILLVVFMGFVSVFDLGDGNITRWSRDENALKLGAGFFTFLFALDAAVWTWWRHPRHAELDKEYEQRADVLERRRRFYAAVASKHRS
jgi:hypothetical protein